MKTTPESLQQEAQEVLENLENTSAKTIITGTAHDWEAQAKRFGFAMPMPEWPAPPPAPEAPDLGPPPREDDTKYGVELSTLDKLLSSRRIKKQQAALNRFEKDRKAWNEDRSYAFGVYEQAQKKYVAQTAALVANHEEAVRAWKQAFAVFLRDLAQGAA